MLKTLARITFGVIFFFGGILLTCCSSEEQRAKALIESGLAAFYKNDSTTFRSLLDTTTLALVNSLVYTHGLTPHNDTLIEVSVSRTTNEDSLNFNCEVQTAHGGTGMFKVTVPNGEDKLYFNETALLHMLKYEGEMCTTIGKIRYGRRMFAQSVHWFLQAREQNIPEAKYYLGLMYFHERKFTDAIVALGEAYKDGYRPALDGLVTAFAFAGRSDEGKALLKAEAEKGDVDAMVRLGESLNLAGPYEDISLESFYWSKMAADRGSTSGMIDVGHFYLTHSERYDYDSALYWYNKAITLGSTVAMEILGQMYIQGYDGEKDFDKGWNLLLEAAKRDPASGYYSMGLLYEYGDGVPVDKSKALKYYKLSAKNGSEIAKEVVKEFEKKQ
jgi:TPR repeat protein